MRTQRHHEQLTNGVGKCSKPMWQFGAPCFCDEPAYGTYIDGPKFRDAYTGELRRLDGKYCGYVPALACPAHGGPEQPVDARGLEFGGWCELPTLPRESSSE